MITATVAASPPQRAANALPAPPVQAANHQPAQIADEVARAAVEQRHQRLCPRAPRGIDTLVEIDLRGDEYERKGTAMQHHAQEQASPATKCAEHKAQHPNVRPSARIHFSRQRNNSAQAEH